MLPMQVKSLEARRLVNLLYGKAVVSGTKKVRGTIPCAIKGCKPKLSNDENLKIHLSLTHGLWSIERPYQCPHEGCNRYYATEDAAKEHNYNAHERKG